MRDGDPGGELNEGASKSILGPNPFVGFRAQDVASAAGELLREAAAHPALVLEQQATLARDVVRVFANQSELRPARDDKRFEDPAWTQNPFYKAALGSYLAWTNALEEFVDKSSFDTVTKQRARFVTQLLTDALSPSNSLANPVALRRALDTGGISLVDGLRNMLSDIKDNGAMPAMVDKSAFEVGKNLAVTPGSVVFANDVLELIQYAPQTEQTFALPLLFVPPQINKYYVFDISPEKSMIDFMLKGGVSCFAISWRNPTAAQRDWNLDTYVDAIVAAIEAARNIAGTEKVNVVGACAGAMTLAALLGYYAAKGGQRPLNSATLLVAVIDSEGESTLFLFATKDSIETAKAASRRKGVLEGEEMGRIFAWLRPNDLVWNYWVNNYLLGKTPPAFDILFWNADTTRLPAEFHADLLDAFAEAKFKKPGAMIVKGLPIDLRTVDLDSYFVAGITDHITPWKGVYGTMTTFGGDKTMVLSAAGHIQSLINPPQAASKRQYYLNPEHPSDADGWLEGASATKGSWWGHWLAWIQERSGDRVAAPGELGNAAHPPQRPAPGSYVLEK